MKLRTIILVMMLAIIPAVGIYAQQKKTQSRDEWRKEMREFRMKFIAQEIELQENQEQKFTALYNQLCDERQVVLKKAHSAEKRLKTLGPKATDEDYRVASETVAKAREEEVALEKKYSEKFGAFLSQKQLFKMKEAENKFRERLVKMRESRKKSKSE